MKSIAMNFSQSGRNLFLLLGVFFYGWVITVNAWLADDAYIGFRTIYNLWNGLGLTWNYGNRVQEITGPLYNLLLGFFYAGNGEIYFTALVCNLAYSIGGVLLFAYFIPASFAAALCSLAALSFSKAYVDFSTSGLENSLSHLLYICFFAVYLQPWQRQKKIFFLSLLAGLAAVNRLDTILLYFPVLAALFFASGKFSDLKWVLAGFIPLFLWELFALFYFGFLFPNTAYMKLLNLNVGQIALFKQGMFYYLQSLDFDPLTLIMIVTALGWVWIRQAKEYYAPAAGIILYLLYVLKIGGCFMSGRFLALPFLASVCLLAALRLPPLFYKGALPAVIVAGLAAAYPTVYSDAAYRMNEPREKVFYSAGIADERGCYFPRTGLLRIVQTGLPPAEPAFLEKKPVSAAPDGFAEKTNVGMLGYMLGPYFHLLNPYGNGDAFLTRMPVRADIPWRIGHYTRVQPEGYQETLASGKNRIKDPELALFYDKMSLITKGPLWSAERLRTIINMNLGKYNYLLRE